MVNPTLPGWAKKYLKDDCFTRVEEAVARAEKTTSGEIVPIVVKRSVKTVPTFYPAWALRLFDSAKNIDSQTGDRAVFEFQGAGITATAGKTGILLFTSLDEHRVVVLADKAIAEKLPPATWQGIVSMIVESIKSGDLTRGLCAAIDECALLVAPHFPPAKNDRNELKDHLILKD